ncbi:putative nuclease HARBI1 [Mercenaria mercenaria]|uniref:putative nuclease HARBI1 n=1 Tax=Mercenaria mercenaria TaxID=6596 RepID=UPI00234E5DDA|nr:putative nuclease HARBI1 [Mercenaria mercenaria]
MVCDARFMITKVVAKWPGSVHDSRIFRESGLCRRFEEGQFDGHLLGDSGYACRQFLLTPYLRPNTPAQERYNEALTKTRVTIEQTFGVLKRRFPCLKYGLRVSPARACGTIVACVILHNFGMVRGDTIQREIVDDEDPPGNDIQVAAGQTGLRYRDTIVDRYFS